LEYSPITVVETLTFQRKVERLLSAVENTELITYLSIYPTSGVLIKGTGGIRKLRWSRSGRGRSGGVRVIYYFHGHKLPLYLLTVFGKNEKSNLSSNEKSDLARLAKVLVKNWNLRP